MIAALVMMGIPPFFRAFAAPTSVEDRLAASPEALAGCSACCGERIAARASRWPSRCIAPTRTPPPSMPPRLLHEFAEMLLWCHAPQLALRIRAMQDADPTLRSSVAQRTVLGIELDELQQALVAAWRLPSLLAETAQEPQAGQTGARAVALGSRLARHTAAGWENAAIPDDIAEVAALPQPVARGSAALLMEIDAD